MKKRILSICLIVSLLAIAIVGGTLAYFTDTAENANTMILGNVAIEQKEYQRATDNDGNYVTDTVDNMTSYKLTDYVDKKPLMPIVGSPASEGAAYPAAGWDSTTVRMSQVGSYGGMQVFAGKNAQDKFVVVQNTGKSDAYVRTLVAIEVGTADPDLIKVSHHQTWKQNGTITAEINGINYCVVELVYAGGELSDGSWRHENGVLTAGDYAYPTLCQVYLKSQATNEDATALDANKDGKVDILVLSQAVQADGFDTAQYALDTAFGDVTDANVAEWFKDVKQ